MNEEEFKECSVVAYPHEIRFLHIKGGHISYYVDRHISDYVNKLQQENEQLKKRLEKIDNILNYCKFEIKKEKDKFPCPLESEQWLKGRISAFEEILQVEKSDK